MMLGGGDNLGTTFGAHHAFKIWEGKNHPKFRAFYYNFRIWLQISL